MRGRRFACTLRLICLGSVGLVLSGCSIAAPAVSAPSSSSQASTSQPTAAPSPTSSETETAVDVHGLVVLSDLGRLSGQAELSVFDPSTGEGLFGASFPVSQDVVVDGPSFGTVSPDLVHLAARQLQGDGTYQAGWIGSDGTFTNVSAPLAEGGSFSGGLNSDRVTFIGDRLYFNVRSVGNDSTDTAYSVPVFLATSGGLSTSDFRKETVATPLDLNARPSFAPDGTVTKRTNGCQSAYGKWAYQPSAFLDKQSYLVLRENTLEELPLDQACGIGFQGNEKLLPTSDQSITQVAVSPDKSQVAIVARRAQQQTYYVLPAAGGTPKQVGGVGGASGFLVAWR